MAYTVSCYAQYKDNASGNWVQVGTGSFSSSIELDDDDIVTRMDNDCDTPNSPVNEIALTILDDVCISQCNIRTIPINTMRDFYASDVETYLAEKRGAERALGLDGTAKELTYPVAIGMFKNIIGMESVRFMHYCDLLEMLSIIQHMADVQHGCTTDVQIVLIGE